MSKKFKVGGTCGAFGSLDERDDQKNTVTGIVPYRGTLKEWFDYTVTYTSPDGGKNEVCVHADEVEM